MFKGPTNDHLDGGSEDYNRPVVEAPIPGRTGRRVDQHHGDEDEHEKHDVKAVLFNIFDHIYLIMFPCSA